MFNREVCMNEPEDFSFIERNTCFVNWRIHCIKLIILILILNESTINCCMYLKVSGSKFIFLILDIYAILLAIYWSWFSLLKPLSFSLRTLNEIYGWDNFCDWNWNILEWITWIVKFVSLSIYCKCSKETWYGIMFIH